ncbi:MAG: hypothetical protein CL746_04365 [Chloroflexi bacterium]|nr:hypothetical protein [Chloroflexota bacterium]|tara:strand:+ start:5586 stop:6419 length:834 start_codon:yes stop_codon:yes gene_type:complete
MIHEYYRVLGLTKSATDKEIKIAFRRLARKYHPDVNQNDDVLKNKFLKVNEAYEVLSNKKTRKDYDEFGEKWKHADQLRSVRSGHNSSSFNMNDLFSGIRNQNMNDIFSFNSNRQMYKQKCDVFVSIEEIYTGTKKMLNLSTPTKNSKNIEVTIPKGVMEGQKIKLKIENDIQLIVTIRIKKNKEFMINGENLTKTIKIPYIDMILGTEIMIESFKGSFMLTIPKLTQNDQIFRIPNKGLPVYKDNKHGNLLIKVTAELPNEIHDGEQEIYEKLKSK